MYTKTLKIDKVSALFQLVRSTCHTKIDRLSEVFRLVYSVPLLATSREVPLLARWAASRP